MGSVFSSFLVRLFAVQIEEKFSHVGMSFCPSTASSPSHQHNQLQMMGGSDLLTACQRIEQASQLAVGRRRGAFVEAASTPPRL